MVWTHPDSSRPDRVDLRKLTARVENSHMFCLQRIVDQLPKVFLRKDDECLCHVPRDMILLICVSKLGFQERNAMSVRTERQYPITTPLSPVKWKLALAQVAYPGLLTLTLAAAWWGAILTSRHMMQMLN